MKEAMSILEDVTEYLTDENLTDMANNLSRILSKVQSTWLAQRLNTATQTKVTDFLNKDAVLKLIFSQIQYKLY